MSLHRIAVQRDKVEPDVVSALERCGFAVERISAKGVPDLLVSRRGHWWVVECKSDPEIGKRGKPLKRSQLRPEQEGFKARHRAPVQVIRSAMEAVTWAGTVP